MTGSDVYDIFFSYFEYMTVGYMTDIIAVG